VVAAGTAAVAVTITAAKDTRRPVHMARSVIIISPAVVC